MRKAGLAALIAAHVLGAQPLSAAVIDDGVDNLRQRTGAFAGARVRLQLGGSPHASAGLTLAPMQRVEAGTGSVRVRFGEGLALGVIGDGPVALRLAGRRVDRLGLVANGNLEERSGKHGISTVGYVAIGVGVAVIVGGLLFLDAVGDASE